MSLLELRDCSLNGAGMIAIAASINKINQLVIYRCGEISIKSWKEMAKNISKRNAPVSFYKERFKNFLITLLFQLT